MSRRSRRKISKLSVKPTFKDESINMAESEKRVERTNLGLIYVETRGFRDELYLDKTNMLIVAVTCRPGKPSTFNWNDDFFRQDDDHWMEAAQEYLTWKRKTFPKFKLPNHSGKTKDGHAHPWGHPVKPPT